MTTYEVLTLIASIQEALKKSTLINALYFDGDTHVTWDTIPVQHELHGRSFKLVVKEQFFDPLGIATCVKKDGLLVVRDRKKYSIFNNMAFTPDGTRHYDYL